MLDQCSHQFVWPRRASDGRYYQVCRICEAEYEYDWESMQRMHGEGNGNTDLASVEVGQVEVEQEEARLEVVTERRHIRISVPPRRVPSPTFLVELEPAHRVFIQNLVDTIQKWKQPQVAGPPWSVPFWKDVFIQSDLPWRWFGKSLIGHLVFVAVVVIMVKVWPSGPIERPSVFHKYVSYYTPPKSFPALGSHQPRPRTKSIRAPQPVKAPAIRVASEHAPKSGQQEAAMRAPELTLGKGGKPKIAGISSPAPIMPLSATGGSHMGVPAGPAWVVAPPPESIQGTGRRMGQLGELQASAVAPAVEAGGLSSGRGSGTPGLHAGVVAPSPSVSGSSRRIGYLNIGESAVVNPAPQLPTDAQGTLSGMGKGTFGGLGSAVVPPSPSLHGSGTLFGGRSSSLSGGGSQVVPPAPSAQGAGDGAASGRLGSLSSGLQVVPPAPSAKGAGNGAGRGSALSGGIQAVPPAPSAEGPGDGAGRGSSLSGGFEAVPPAPSVQGEGEDSGRGNGNSLSADAQMQAMPPSASSQGAGEGSGGSGSSGGDGLAKEDGKGAGSDSSSAGIDPNEPATIEIPLRLIAPVMALPGSSYFSNYEVFIAERKVGKDQPLLIKLVYVSLPYQQRLSEYAAKGSTVNKLRITRDKSCDESLMQMTWPETDPRPDSQNSADSPALTAKDRKGMLPCYRTTADDFRRALEHKY
jgi:hypothetical protein